MGDDTTQIQGFLISHYKQKSRHKPIRITAFTLPFSSNVDFSPLGFLRINQYFHGISKGLCCSSYKLKFGLQTSTCALVCRLSGDKTMLLGNPKIQYIPHQNLSWNLKMMVSKRNLLFQGLLFRFHVKFLGCNILHNQLKLNQQVYHFFFNSTNFLKIANSTEHQTKNTPNPLNHPKKNTGPSHNTLRDSPNP